MATLTKPRNLIEPQQDSINTEPTYQPTGLTQEQVMKNLSNFGYQAPTQTTPQVGGAVTRTGIISQDGTTPISAGTIGTVKPLNLAPTPIPNGGEALSSITTAVKESGMQTKLEEATANAEAEKNTGEKNIRDLYNEIAGVQDKAVSFEEQANLAKKEQRVTDYTNELEGLERSELNEIRALEQGVGTGMSTQGKAEAIAAVRRKYAFQKADVALLQSAANRDFQTAQNIINRKIELKLEPLKLKLENEKFFYEENREDFNKKEEREYKAKLAADERAIKKVEANGTQINDWIGEAIKNGQPELVEEFGKLDPESPTFMKDIASVQSKFINYDKIQDRRIKKAQAEKLEAEVKAMTESSGGNADDLTAYASRLAADGKLPNPSELKQSNLTVGQVAQAARLIPQPKGYIADNSTGVKPTTVSTAEQEDFSRLYNITQNIKQLKILENKRSEGLISGTLGKIFGAEDQERYLTLRKTIVDDMSRMQSGAALTQDEVNFYQDYLPGRYGEITPFQFGADSQQRIDDFATNMNSKLQERLNNRGISIYGYSTVEHNGKNYVVGSKIKLSNGKEGIVLPGGYINELN